MKVNFEAWMSVATGGLMLAALAIGHASDMTGQTLLAISIAVVAVGSPKGLAWRLSKDETEESSFEALRQACLDHDPVAALTAHTLWLSHLDLDASAEVYEAFPEWIEVQLAVCSPTCEWQGDELLAAVEQQRAALLEQPLL